jgi:hypothetical protein
VVAVNRPGGGGVLMHELLAQAKPDGYTLGVVSTGVMTRTPFLRKVKYNPEKDFTYILLYRLVAVRPGGPVRQPLENAGRVFGLRQERIPVRLLIPPPEPDRLSTWPWNTWRSKRASNGPTFLLKAA